MEKMTCPICNGCGRDVVLECPNCKGTGWFPQEDNAFAQCRECRGEGEIEYDVCPKCDGDGTISDSVDLRWES